MITHQYYSPLRKEEVRSLPRSELLSLYETMTRIRLVEEKVADLIKDKEIVCPCHLYIGQEAIATGVCAALTVKDYVYSTHRSHGHYLAKGGSVKGLMAEIYGKSTGCSRGNGGSMHLAAPHIGYPGSSAIVGGTIPLAVGTALSFYIDGSRNVSVSFFGDGAATEGVFYESINFAALKKLPVVFVCENNFYSTHMHITAIQPSSDIFRRAKAFDVPAVKIDGNNVIEVHNAASEAVTRARAGEGPSLIECVTYRWRGHVGPNWDIEKGLRSREEVDFWVDNCAIKRTENFFFSEGLMSPSEKERILQKVRTEIEDALNYARSSPYPEVSEYKNKVFK
ncbi:MAG: thiamine pyrophosphate-dependent dehydrogenase E1 component subunit alpha [Deltaproteobacteria bacterium]|nr:thiamine pyrophosphate-dependent dehydrogenase E1 component subunit alpha [Deltaproteobacteria bacterium]